MKVFLMVDYWGKIKEKIQAGNYHNIIFGRINDVVPKI